MPVQEEFNQEFARLAKRYNELIYENRIDPSVELREFFKCVGSLVLIGAIIYALFLLCIVVLFSEAV